MFDLDFTSDAVIGPDGSFMFTARNDSTNSDLDPAVFTVRGTFSGSTVLGRITGRTTKTRRNSLYTTCTGNQVFWAKRGG